MREKGIETEINYQITDYSQTAIRSTRASIAETERACDEVLTLPCFPEMSDREASAVIRALVETQTSLDES